MRSHSVQCPDGSGGEWDERLFEEVGYCDGCNLRVLADDLTAVEGERYDDDMLCPKCLVKHETKHQ